MPILDRRQDAGRQPDSPAATGTADRKKAEALRASLVVEEQDERANGETLASCITTYLESREHEVGAKTYGQIKFLMGASKTIVPSAASTRPLN